MCRKVKRTLYIPVSAILHAWNLFQSWFARHQIMCQMADKYLGFKHFRCQALKHAIMCFLPYLWLFYIFNVKGWKLLSRDCLHLCFGSCFNNTAVGTRSHKSFKSKRDSTLPLSTATRISCTAFIIVRIPSSAWDSEFVVHEKLFACFLGKHFAQSWAPVWRQAKH